MRCRDWLIQALQVESKLWTKGTASAVPHSACAVEGFSPLVRFFQFLMANYASFLGVTDSDALYQAATLVEPMGPLKKCKPYFQVSTI